MDLPGVTYVGDAVDDPETFAKLPAGLQRVLEQANGIVAYRGGLHLRGASVAPGWHSLREAWLGESALHLRYPAVRAADIPFAEDAVGDQWLLRDGRVLRLHAETGEVESLGLGLLAFWDAIEHNPMQALGLEPLLQYEDEGGRLQPGQLLSAYPPFCTAESGSGVSLRAVPATERIIWLAEFAAAISGAPDGSRVKLTTRRDHQLGN